MAKKKLTNSLETKLADYKRRNINRVKLAITDIDGVMRGKYVSLEKFASLFKNGGGFCDCVFGWDVVDQLYDNTTFTGWHTAYPDALFRLDTSSERFLQDEGIPFFIADFVGADGVSEHKICPRNVLKRVLKKAEVMGLGFNLAFEYEFFLFNETPHSIIEKNFQNLIPFTPGMFGYSMIRNSTHSELFNEFMTYCDSLGVQIEGLHCETGPGVWETAIQYSDALLAADNAAIFKTFTKVFFQKRGLIPTFMARWNVSLPGQSGHIHQSAYHPKSKKPLFYSGKASYCMSPTMSQYLAGQMKYVREFLPLTTPNINSYTRLVKGFWAPTASTWGVENRTTALRVIPGTEKSQRVEYRVGSADANPYLAAAAVIGAGLLGIEQKLKLTSPVVGSAYEVQDKLPEDMQFPTNLRSATSILKKSKEAPEIFGSDFIRHYIETREWEVREYEKAITDWQLKRYFEII